VTALEIVADGACLERVACEPRITPNGPAMRIVSALVFLTPVSAAVSSAFGSVEVAGQTVYPFKVIVPALFLLTPSQSIAVLRRSGSFPQLLLALAVWGWLGVAWATDRTAALREVSILVFATIAAASLVAAVRNSSNIRALVRGWLAAGVVTFGVAGWELTTGKHLATQFVKDRGGNVSGVLLSTFGNPNNFGAFIVLTLPFISIAVSSCGSTWGLTQRDRTVATILSGLLPVVLVLSGSRLALLGLLAFAVTYVYLNRQWRSAWLFGLASTAGFLALLLVALATGQELIQKFAHVFDTTPFTINSVQTRINLVRNGVTFFLRTGGVGLGPGGFENAIQTGDHPFPVKPGVVNAHNFWIEVTSQYGIVGVVILIGGLAFTTLALLRREGGSLGVRRTRSVLIAGFAGYVFASTAASSYVNSPENWTFIGSYIALASVGAVHAQRARFASTHTAGEQT
jgi:teichuronic acid biosynthesis protein TuaE